MAKKANQAADEGSDKAQETAPDAGEQAQDASNGASDQSEGLISGLKDTAVESALEILKPAVKSASESAANYAVSKGPELIKDKLGSLGDSDGMGDMANNLLSKAGPVGKVASKLGMGGKLASSVLPGGDDEDGDEEGGGEAEADATGSGRRMPVQQAVDIAVPLEVVYNQWTQFEEYPNFMHRVDSASQEDDANVTFTEKMWGFSRDFKAEIVEQRPNERIVWRSVNGLKHAGVVTFHQLAERLTRVEVTVDFMPQGFFEKIGRGSRFSKRAIRADMHRFKAYVEMNQEEDGSWLGTIEDGEVTKDHQQAQEEREAEESEEGEGAEAEAEEEPEASEEEEAEASGEEETEEEEDQAAEEEPEASEEEAEEQPEEEAEEQPEEEAEEQPEEEAEEQPEEEAEEQPEQKPAAKRRRAPSSDGGQKRSGGRQRSRPSGQRSQGGRKRPKSPRSPQRRTAKSSAR